MTRHRSLRFAFAALFAACSAFAQVADPHITSWRTAASAQYARVYESAAKFTSGTTVTTWPSSGLVTSPNGGVSTVTYSDVQRVAYSTNYVYIYTTGLASYTMGNWLTPNGTTYTSFPSNRAAIHRIPRNPSIPTTKQKNNGNGGVLVNGVYVWQNGDAQSYSNTGNADTATTATISMSGDGVWNRLAGVAETFNFDPANGHQPSSGAYHNHINPKALRYQLGDNVSYNSSSKTYSESGTPTKHSPIIGWANDGLPIYGPYGYSTATDSSSGIRRMTSGFVKRDSTNAALYPSYVVDLAVTGRHTLPVWAASVQGISATLSSSKYGPTTTATYNLGPTTKTCSVGTFAEDYEYLGDCGKTQGVDFDLNRQNVRYCVTPEYPSGTYAYFVCIDSSGSTVFPDVINQEYFGSAAVGTGTVNSISESVTEYVDAGPAANIALTGTASSSNVLLSWNSAEGATYKVESSPDSATWTTLSSTVTSAGLTTTYTATGSTNYYRVTLTAIATYDTGGTYGTPVGKTATLLYGTAASAPSITTQPTGATVTTGTSVTFTVVASGTGTLSYQWKKGGTNISGATSASYTLASPTTSDSGSYTVTVTNSIGTTTSSAATLTVNAPATAPTITTQPTGASVSAGANVTFTVVASGTAPLSYQWSKNGATISGATSASYSLTNVQAADSANYTVVVTNSAGSITSNAATLAVNGAAVAPSVTTSPASATAIVGGSVTFSVVASGTAPLSYQWRKGGANISGATSSSYSISSAQTSDAGSYDVVVSNSAGSANSSAATLTVNTPATAPTITTQPASVSVTTGTGATFTVAASGTAPLTYQWRKNGANISGASSASYAIASAQSADAANYDCVVTNSAGSATSNVATLAVTASATVPTITTQPANVTANVGGAAAFTVAAGGTAPLGYQWRKDGVAITGATLASYSITSVQSADAGSYTVVVTNSLGTVTSDAATLTVTTGATAPAITVQPQAASAVAGGSVTFSIVASGTAPLGYQWLKNGAAIPGATSASFTLNSAQSTDLGTYACTVTNTAGTVTSRTAALSLTTVAVAPAIITQPATTAATTGSAVTLSVTVSGTSPLSYLWRKDGVAIAGATTSTYSLNSAQLTDSGAYTVTVANTAGTVTSSAAALTVSAPAPVSTARIINLAVRTRVGGTAGAPTVGFVMQGTGSGKRVIVRAVGPTLTVFGVSGALAAPQLSLMSGSTKLATNSGWLATDAPAFASVGAFPLNTGSADAAIVSTLAPGAYTTPLTVASGASGVVLIECYDGAPTDTSVRLVNASALAYVGTGDDVLIPAFVISGEGTVKVLVRAVGPGLAPFGLTNALADPQLILYKNNAIFDANDDWNLAANKSDIASAATASGAFALAPNSKDAALLVSLSAGSYSATVSGVNSLTGPALVEIYVVP